MSSQRATPYVSKPSEALKARLAQAQQSHSMFVVQTPGPTSFVLKSEDVRKKMKVCIGLSHSCSCGSRDQPCVHVAFVLLRVFRLAPEDPRCWQSSLIDSELEALVNSRALAAAQHQRAGQVSSAPTAHRQSAEGGTMDVLRRPIDDPDDSDPCPICYECIGRDDDDAGELDWCRRGCGKSLHRRCFAMWAEHQTSIGQKLTCPYCRSEWASDQPLRAPVRMSEATRRAGARGGLAAATHAEPRPAIHRGIRCRSCRTTPITGIRYRCLVCNPHLNLCADCHRSCMHPHHPFGYKERPGWTWKAAPCRSSPSQRLDDARMGHVERAASADSGNDAALQYAINQLQHREITPDDYELLLALSNTDISNVSSRRPLADTPAPDINASLASRCVEYTEEQVAPMIDELNEIDSEARRARQCAPTSSPASQQMVCVDGRAIEPLAPRADMTIAIGRPGRAAGAAPFGSSASRRCHNACGRATSTADRLPAEQMRASSGFEDINLVGNSCVGYRQPQQARSSTASDIATTSLPLPLAIPFPRPSHPGCAASCGGDGSLSATAMRSSKCTSHGTMPHRQASRSRREANAIRPRPNGVGTALSRSGDGSGASPSERLLPLTRPADAQLSGPPNGSSSTSGSQLGLVGMRLATSAL